MKDHTDTFLILQVVIIILSAILGTIAIVTHYDQMEKTTALLNRTAKYVVVQK